MIMTLIHEYEQGILINVATKWVIPAKAENPAKVLRYWKIIQIDNQGFVKLSVWQSDHRGWSIGWVRVFFLMM